MEGCLGSLSSEEARRYLAGILIWNEVYRKSKGRDAVMQLWIKKVSVECDVC